MRLCTAGEEVNVLAPAAPPGRIRMLLVGVVGRVVLSGRMRMLRLHLLLGGFGLG